MKLAQILAVITFLTITLSLPGQSKKTITHEVYDDWKGLKSKQISNNGNLVSYEINPQKGDGKLFFYNTGDESYKSFPRGFDARFSPSNKYSAFKIKPQYDTVRKEKLARTKKEKLPKDSIGIWVYGKETIYSDEKVKSFKLPEEGSEWMAYLMEMPKPEPDTSEKKDKVKKDKDKEGKSKKKDKDNNQLVVINPITGRDYVYENVSEYNISENGKLICFIQQFNDSDDSTSVYVFYTETQELLNLMSISGNAKKPVVSKNGDRVAFLFSPDTAKTKVFSLFSWKHGKREASMIVDAKSPGMPESWSVSEHGKLFFSEDNQRLYFGTAIKPEPEPEETLTEDEKVSVDIWNWKDLKIQTQQNEELEKEKKKSYTAVYHLKEKRMVQLTDELVRDVRIDKKSDLAIITGTATKPYWKELSWESSNYKDIYLIDQRTGTKKLALEKVQSYVSLSPEGNYLAWYNSLDSAWYIYNIQNKNSRNFTANLKVPFYNILNDTPNEAWPYGMAGWTKSGGKFLVYDQYDIWMLDPGSGTTENLTASWGRSNEIKIRILDLDPEEPYIDFEKPLFLSLFNEKDKSGGYASLSPGSGNKVKKRFSSDHKYSRPKKAKDSDLIIWQRESFQEYPDLHLSDVNFTSIFKLTNTNPRQAKYYWGNVELVDWVSLDGEELEGLLYKPENFDPEKKYPMLVYFYERYSNNLHRHYVPKPSRSVINFTYYTSNGYIIFVPDIKYKTGFPGESAYNSIVAGTLKMLERTYIDKERVGIQGQSWGGYQVAYLVTQTDLYTAAMAGAPVSNMTSAYGGIRWSSGKNRMFQYEEGQSRIGGTLWEKPMRYIENSPLFFADKVNTPLLMMHNDDDGAVPWYQGIEYFVALRRLNKPVWMLTYNKAPHNLKRRADMEDLTVRMQQFFDHYLKGAPAPKWMTEGIPAIDKGKEFGFETE